MGRVQIIQTNFTGGENSPGLDGRVDLAKYANACRTLENYLLRAQGGVDRRGGFRHVAAAKVEAKRPRLIPFEFSTEQAYIIELGEGYARFYRDEGRIESPPGTPVEIAAPWLEAELFEIQFTQSADVLYLTHPAHWPRVITRTSHTAWSIALFDAEDGPWLDLNAETAKTLTLTSGAGFLKGTTGAVLTAAGHAPFQAGHVGGLWRLQAAATNDSASAWVEVTAFTSATQVTVKLRKDVPAALQGAATAHWREGSWSTVRGFPATVMFYEERLFFAGAQPQRLDGSKSGAFNVFTPGTAEDDDPVSFTLAGDQVNAIKWLATGRALFAGSIGAEWTVRATTFDEPVTPTNIQARIAGRLGSEAVQPVATGAAILFVQRAGEKLRELTYSFERDAFVGRDLTIFADHMMLGGVRQLALAAAPAPRLWAARNDGMLLALTYEPDHEVIGWQRHPIGGTAAAVESVAVIPAPAGDHDQLWIVAKRTIQGQTRRYVEFLVPPLAPSGDQADGFYVDSGLTYSGAPATTISGLGHLEGETVRVVGDGAVLPDRVVTGGQITLPRAKSKVHVGLGYRSLLETVRYEAGAEAGTAQGQLQRIFRGTVRLYRTLGLKVGGSLDKLDELTFRSTADAMDAPPPLFTGDKAFRPRGTYSTEARLFLVQEDPGPGTILALMPELTATSGV